MASFTLKCTNFPPGAVVNWQDFILAHNYAPSGSSSAASPTTFSGVPSTGMFGIWVPIPGGATNYQVSPAQTVEEGATYTWDVAANIVQHSHPSSGGGDSSGGGGGDSSGTPIDWGKYGTYALYGVGGYLVLKMLKVIK